jgi:hypothetical protein
MAHKNKNPKKSKKARQGQGISEKQLEANRQNAQHSGGPTSKAGKRKSGKNALKYGLTSEFYLFREEKTEVYQEHCDMLIYETQPQGYLEHKLVLDLCENLWRRDRAKSAEQKINATSGSEEERDERMRNVSLSTGRINNQIYRALAELRRQRTDRANGNKKTVENEELLAPREARGGNDTGLVATTPTAMPYPAEEGDQFKRHMADIAMSLRQEDPRSQMEVIAQSGDQRAMEIQLKCDISAFNALIGREPYGTAELDACYDWADAQNPEDYDLAPGQRADLTEATRAQLDAFTALLSRFPYGVAELDALVQWAESQNPENYGVPTPNAEKTDLFESLKPLSPKENVGKMGSFFQSGFVRPTSNYLTPKTPKISPEETVDSGSKSQQPPGNTG